MDKTTIESLSIIQRTPSKPSDTTLQIIDNENSFEYQVMGLLFNSTAEKLTCIILQRTSTDNTKPKVAESENIGANHLGFAKSLFQHYCQYLGLNHNHIFAKSAFNFYVNKKISSLLGTPKTKVELPTASSYYYTLRSAINITSASAFTSNVISTFERFPFQSKQRKTDLLGPYEEKEKELEDQEFTYQNPITENPKVETSNLQAQQNLNLKDSEIKTPNHQRQNNPKPELINQQNLPPPPQQPNLDPMAYAPIAKLDNFTGEEDNAQVWLNDVEKAIIANG
ncbi:hypothetical protein G9A89_021442 [Geosiphon pyriformis]|nr:hypothetical protein G9A89_021442 [Geosiphon pyriformis]